MKRLLCLLFTVMGVILASRAQAQPVIDGKADASYGAALSVQNTNTQFGDATTGDPVNGGGGSEIDQVFGKIENGRLYVTVAGNLERNFNKLEVFIDSEAAGVNTLDGSSLPAGVDAFCCGGFGTTSGALQRMNGLTFDTGFGADHFVTFSNGFESVGPEISAGQRETQFWAVSAHYADLTDGTAGAVVAAGVQFAHRGLPNVLRFPGDYNDNGRVDAADFTKWRDTLGATVSRGIGADANGDLTINDADYEIWKTRFNSDTSLAGSPFKPDILADGVSEALLGPNLPGLAQGQLVDSTYALSASGGCNANNTGAGCVAKELEFVLPLDPADPSNAENHRAFTNTAGLQLGFDNSNTVGVNGNGPYTDPTTGDPQNVISGLEFSIPLSQIGNPTGDVKLMIFVNGGGHDYASNQFAGDGILEANLGGNGFGGFIGDLSGVNMNDFAGNQFVTVPHAGAGAVSAVPEPASLLIGFVALVGCGATTRRRN